MFSDQDWVYFAHLAMCPSLTQWSTCAKISVGLNRASLRNETHESDTLGTRSFDQFAFDLLAQTEVSQDQNMSLEIKPN